MEERDHPAGKGVGLADVIAEFRQADEPAVEVFTAGRVLGDLVVSGPVGLFGGDADVRDTRVVNSLHPPVVAGPGIVLVRVDPRLVELDQRAIPDLLQHPAELQPPPVVEASGAELLLEGPARHLPGEVSVFLFGLGGDQIIVLGIQFQPVETGRLRLRIDHPRVPERCLPPCLVPQLFG